MFIVDYQSIDMKNRMPLDFSSAGSNHWMDNVARAQELRREFVALCKKYNITSAIMSVGRVDDPSYNPDFLHPLFLSATESESQELECVNVINQLIAMKLTGDSRIVSECDEQFKSISRHQQSVDDMVSKLLSSDDGKEKGQDES